MTAKNITLNVTHDYISSFNTAFVQLVINITITPLKGNIWPALV